MPPSKPPSGSYTSTVGGDLSSWSGSFNYDQTDGSISYHRTDPSKDYTSTNESKGNAFVFSLSDKGARPVHFNGPHYTTGHNGKANYSGTASDRNPKEGEGDWTATQS